MRSGQSSAIVASDGANRVWVRFSRTLAAWLSLIERLHRHAVHPIDRRAVVAPPMATAGEGNATNPFMVQQLLLATRGRWVKRDDPPPQQDPSAIGDDPGRSELSPRFSAARPGANRPGVFRAFPLRNSAEDQNTDLLLNAVTVSVEFHGSGNRRVSPPILVH